MNELHEQFAKKGLVVVGVTNEDESTVSKFIKQNKLSYPIAIDRADAGSKAYGVNGIPHAALIDPKGNLVWSGHPGELNKGKVEKAMAGAIPPGLKGPLAAVGKSLDKDECGAAYKTLKDLLAGGSLDAENKALAEQMVGQLEADAKTLFDEGQAHAEKKEWYLAVSKLERAGRNFAGIGDAATAAQKAAELRAKPELGKEIEGGAKLEMARRLEDEKEFTKAYDQYMSVAKAYAATSVADLARTAAAAIKDAGKYGFLKTCASCSELGIACPKHKKKAP